MSESMLCAVLAFFKQTVLGTVQWRFAENIANGPSFLNGSSTYKKGIIRNIQLENVFDAIIISFVTLTLYTVKSGSVNESTNFDAALMVASIISKFSSSLKLLFFNSSSMHSVSINVFKLASCKIFVSETLFYVWKIEKRFNFNLLICKNQKL